MRDPKIIAGMAYYPEYLDAAAQAALRDDIRDVARLAPLFAPVTPGGRQMSVRMTSAGSCGWVTDRKGYRYEPRHPAGQPWPPIPESLLEIWDSLCSGARRPDTCLVNYYSDNAKMGLHQDKDETDLSQPVLSISLGDDARFRIGGAEKRDPTQSLWLYSGDIIILKGLSRLAYHGVDRIRAGTSTLLTNGGRINLTLRVAR